MGILHHSVFTWDHRQWERCRYTISQYCWCANVSVDALPSPREGLGLVLCLRQTQSTESPSPQTKLQQCSWEAIAFLPYLLRHTAPRVRWRSSGTWPVRARDVGAQPHPCSLSSSEEHCCTTALLPHHTAQATSRVYPKSEQDRRAQKPQKFRSWHSQQEPTSAPLKLCQAICLRDLVRSKFSDS